MASALVAVLEAVYVLIAANVLPRSFRIVNAFTFKGGHRWLKKYVKVYVQG